MTETTKIHSMTVNDRNDRKTNSHIVITVGEFLNEKEAGIRNSTVLQIDKDVIRDCFYVQTDKAFHTYGAYEVSAINYVKK